MKTKQVEILERSESFPTQKSCILLFSVLVRKKDICGNKGRSYLGMGAFLKPQCHSLYWERSRCYVHI